MSCSVVVAVPGPHANSVVAHAAWCMQVLLWTAVQLVAGGNPRCCLVLDERRMFIYMDIQHRGVKVIRVVVVG